MLTIRPPIVPTTVRSRSTESASRQRSSSSGKSVPMSPPPGGAEQRVDHRVGEHVGVGVAAEAALVLDLDPAQDQGAALGEAVAVVADADAHQISDSRHPRGSGARLRSRRSKTQISSTPSSPRNSSARA